MFTQRCLINFNTLNVSDASYKKQIQITLSFLEVNLLNMFYYDRFNKL